MVYRIKHNNAFLSSPSGGWGAASRQQVAAPEAVLCAQSRLCCSMHCRGLTPCCRPEKYRACNVHVTVLVPRLTDVFKCLGAALLSLYLIMCCGALKLSVLWH